MIETLASWPSQATWGEWLERFGDLAPRVLRRPARVLRVLGELRAMGAIGPVALEEARDVLDEQLENLKDLARWTAAHVAAAVLDDPRAATNAAFIRGIDINDLQFDPEAMAARLTAACRETSEAYAWRFEVPCMARFKTERLQDLQAVELAAAGGAR